MSEVKSVKVVDGYLGRGKDTFNGEYKVESLARRVQSWSDEPEVPTLIKVFLLDETGKKRGVTVAEGNYQYIDSEGNDFNVPPMGKPRSKKETAAKPVSKPTKIVTEVKEKEMPATVENVSAFEMKSVPAKPQIVPIKHEIEVPKVSVNFVPGTNFSTVKSIVSSEMFMPMLVTGPSGNGKTFMIEQACAKAKRKMIRVQISPETDEDALIGGMRLIDGNTVFEKGPVVNAMEAGAILLIDEIDRGSNKIMCLQGIMEGSAFVIKRTGETIHPKEGFNIIATGNTKGNGSEDGSFSAATVIDDAFMERFAGVIDQGWPTISQEKNMLVKHCKEYGIDLTSSENNKLVERLTRWAKTIRTSFNQGGIECVISTRRLTHILKTYSVLGKLDLAVNMACSKFDESEKEALLSTLSLITGDEVDTDEEDKAVPFYTPDRPVW